MVFLLFILFIFLVKCIILLLDVLTVSLFCAQYEYSELRLFCKPSSLFFIYADDFCITAHDNYFEKIGANITSVINNIVSYYNINYLRANPEKTQHTRSSEKPRVNKRVRSILVRKESTASSILSTLELHWM